MTDMPPAVTDMDAAADTAFFGAASGRTCYARIHYSGWVLVVRQVAQREAPIGSLHTPIEIKGPLKSPSIRPELGGLAVRGGIAGALGVVMPPLAILGTIEFGKDESRECAARVSSIKRSDRAKAAPAATAPTPARRRGR